ncbi:hypothetical protein HOY82DRAFT_596307 [Tuber indicum]|nr:hypothetical protein HOY82DRAFT_596307 [Tuber indicum]
MASEILRAMDKAVASRKTDPLVFKQLNPMVSYQILQTLRCREDYTNTLDFRLHFIAPDGYLRVVIPSAVHESAVGWMRKQWASWIHQNLLIPSATEAIDDVLITYDNFVGIFEGSSKTPDLAYIPCFKGIGSQFPSIVLESGWTESEAQLLRDGEIWQQGTAGAVKVVLLFKMCAPNINNEIKATLHICRYSANQVPVMSSYAIFPPPVAFIPDPFITINELFAGQTPTQIDATTHLP